MDVVQSILTAVVSFVVVLSVVVFVHEFGHFQVARWLKVAIDTFSIGFGKSIASWRDKHGVVWKIGSLPLGGYVKFADDADGVSMGPKTELQDPAAKEAARRAGMFHAQPVLTRALVVVAGPMFNFVFAIAAFATLTLIVGRDPPTVEVVTANSPAAIAGFRAGDRVRFANGERIEDFNELRQTIAMSANREIAFVVEREGRELALAATPQLQTIQDEATGKQVQRLVLGIQHTGVAEKLSVPDAIFDGWRQSWEIVRSTVTYLGRIITGQDSGRQIAGPLGIATMSGQVAEQSLGGPADVTLGQRLIALALNMLQWAAILSVAVGFVNLLPIPVLDGGHLLFYSIEALRGGKPLPAAAQEWAFRAGLAVMACLFLFATWNDVTRHLGSLG